MTCEVCKYGIVEEHHIVPRSDGGSDHYENKVELFPNHHKTIQVLMRTEAIINDKLKQRQYKYKQNAKIFRDFNHIISCDKPCYEFYNQRIKPLISGILMSDAQLIKFIQKNKMKPYKINKLGLVIFSKK